MIFYFDHQFGTFLSAAESDKFPKFIRVIHSIYTYTFTVDINEKQFKQYKILLNVTELNRTNPVKI